MNENLTFFNEFIRALDFLHLKNKLFLAHFIALLRMHSYALKYT